MKLGINGRSSPIFIAFASLLAVSLLVWIVLRFGASTSSSNALSPQNQASSGPTLGPSSLPEASTQIPEPGASTQSQDQQAQADALKAEQEKAAAEAQQAQLQQGAPKRFECEVTGVRVGDNRSLLRVAVSAPADIPEVWVSVNTERGDLDGKIQLTSGQGDQIVPLRNPSQGFRPTIKVYSMPILTEQYEMCSFR